MAKKPRAEVKGPGIVDRTDDLFSTFYESEIGQKCIQTRAGIGPRYIREVMKIAFAAGVAAAESELRKKGTSC